MVVMFHYLSIVAASNSFVIIYYIFNIPNIKNKENKVKLVFLLHTTIKANSWLVKFNLKF
jgi:hypothetical protein